MRTLILFIISLFGLTSGLNGKAIASEQKFIQDAIDNSVFIYDTASKPCDPPKNLKTEPTPLGSGFIVGLRRKGTDTSYNFIITAEHVISGRESITTRMNKSDKSGFVCFDIGLSKHGNKTNTYTADKPEVDMAAINVTLPKNTDPVIIDYSLILDEKKMVDNEVSVGTDVFTVGYLFGYSGKKKNYPVVKFGKIAMLTEEAWYQSPRSNLNEEGYLIELQNVPGLSGAAIMLLSPQIKVTEKNELLTRRMPPFVVGIIKGVLLHPVTSTQGLAVIEPAYHLRDFLKSIVSKLRGAGIDIELGKEP